MLLRRLLATWESATRLFQRAVAEIEQTAIAETMLSDVVCIVSTCRLRPI